MSSRRKQQSGASSGRAGAGEKSAPGGSLADDYERYGTDGIPKHLVHLVARMSAAPSGSRGAPDKRPRTAPTESGGARGGSSSSSSAAAAEPAANKKCVWVVTKKHRTSYHSETTLVGVFTSERAAVAAARSSFDMPWADLREEEDFSMPDPHTYALGDRHAEDKTTVEINELVPNERVNWDL
jgi:hypothetical protein